MLFAAARVNRIRHWCSQEAQLTEGVSKPATHWQYTGEGASAAGWRTHACRLMYQTALTPDTLPRREHVRGKSPRASAVRAGKISNSCRIHGFLWIIKHVLGTSTTHTDHIHPLSAWKCHTPNNFGMYGLPYFCRSKGAGPHANPETITIR